jgi:DNA-binding CsgD family transcriptional regulator
VYRFGALRARLDTGWPDGVEDGGSTQVTPGLMRSWLVRGSRRFAVDPRRRFGRNGGARRLLANEIDTAPSRHGAWGGLVSALQRHTVHGELSQLSKEDRQILSMAYLYGHTNREIAQMLDVSISTVRRRLSQALSRLEESMRRAGLWISLFALGALALYNRLNHSARGTRLPATLAAVAAGTATVVTLGVVAVGPTAAPAAASPAQHRVHAGVVFPHAALHATVVVTTTTSRTANVKSKIARTESTRLDTTSEDETQDRDEADDDSSDGSRPADVPRNSTHSRAPGKGSSSLHLS